jgi:lysophospholipase L1-like esterase
VLAVVGTNVALTALLLLAVEGAVRLALPELGPAGMDAHLVAAERYGRTPGLRPGAEGEAFGATVRVDSGGFVAYSTPPRRGATWLFLGDSVTLGIGVHPDSTFAGRVAAAVDTAAVRNPSLPGYAAQDYVAVLRALASHSDLRLRRATVVWCLNDAYPPGATDAGAPARRVAGPVLGFLQRHVRTYAWAKVAFADRPRTYLLHDLPHYDGDAFTHADRQLAALRALADSAGLQVDLVLIPYEPQLRADAPPEHLRPQRRLAEAAARHGIPLHDATDAFRLEGHAVALYRYGDGIHLSERGHALLADWLLERL